MMKNVVAFLTSLIASFIPRNTDRSCLRKVAAALLIFHILLLGAIMIHMETTVHAHSLITGEVIHISAEHDPSVSTHAQNQEDYVAPLQTEEEDPCALFNKMLRPDTSSSIEPQPLPVDSVIISSELIARKLDIVYRSTRLLQQAPKNSPPHVLS